MKLFDILLVLIYVLLMTFLMFFKQQQEYEEYNLTNFQLICLESIFALAMGTYLFNKYSLQ